MPSITINSRPYEAPVVINAAWLRAQVGAPEAHQVERVHDFEPRFRLVDEEADTACDGDRYVVAPRTGGSA